MPLAASGAAAMMTRTGPAAAMSLAASGALGSATGTSPAPAMLQHGGVGGGDNRRCGCPTLAARTAVGAAMGTSAAAVMLLAASWATGTAMTPPAAMPQASVTTH
jgi:hypothetical protein